MEATNRNQIIMLGTGDALVTHCYNTCFILRTTEGMLLVDAGGGNGILTQLEKAGIQLTDIHEMFLTHTHTDHLLGAVWMVRMAVNAAKAGIYKGTFTVYSHDRALYVLEQICRMTLSATDMTFIGRTVIFQELHDNEKFRAGGMNLQCFDIQSTKAKQFGFRAQLPDGMTLVCLGDEPYNELNRSYAEHADWLMSEAFCLYRDRDIFKPYEKHHTTALEAGANAARLGAKNLLLYHTEDHNLPTRKHDYSEEARRSFGGHIFVPDDLEVLDC